MSINVKGNADGISGAIQVNGVDAVVFNATGITLGGQLAGFRNALINGNFGINQRVVTGTVTLAAGIYGHDRFKAGAGGCTYTFATTNNVTTLTISAGTLQQVIEGINLQSGNYKLSWTGTVQGKVDSGAFGATGVTGTAVGGTNQTVEFGIGTLAKVQYEFGTVATLFEFRSIGQELALCERYYEVGGFFTIGYAASAGLNIGSTVKFRVRKRSSATITQSSTSASNCSSTTAQSSTGDNADSFLSFRSGTATGGAQYSETWVASAEL